MAKLIPDSLEKFPLKKINNFLTPIHILFAVYFH